MDGPQNDKDRFALTPVAKRMTIGTQNMVSWSSFRGEEGLQLRVGFMSQVSTDGRYVVTTIRPPGTSTTEFHYVWFLQVFYPTRGILAWYDRATKKLKPLLDADGPRYIRSNAVWSRTERTQCFHTRWPGSVSCRRIEIPNARVPLF